MGGYDNGNNRDDERNNRDDNRPFRDPSICFGGVWVGRAQTRRHCSDIGARRHSPGAHTLMARAGDAGSNLQPIQRDAHRGSYIISHVQPIEVEVRKISASELTDAYAI